VNTETAIGCRNCGLPITVYNYYCDACGENNAAYAPDTPRPPVAILNTSIATADGTYTLRTVTLDEALTLIGGGPILSAVGHESTAQILTALLGREVAVNRIQFEQEAGQVALVFKLNGRAPEGRILTADEVAAIGYTLKIMERTA
jgi:hypothetical protein